jgi:hypothetical protein
LKKALYGLKQAPRAWYSILDIYLQQKGFKKGNADNTLYIKVNQDSVLIIEVYVYDITFGSDDDRMSKKFSKYIHNEFEMSLIGYFYFFFGSPDMSEKQRYLYLSDQVYQINVDEVWNERLQTSQYSNPDQL